MKTKINNLREDTPAVEFEDVHMIFPGKLKKAVYALQGMNLKIPAGSVVGLLGPNGCGKTTAVSCLMGLLFPQKGRLRVWGSPVHKICSYTIGVVLEDTRLPPFLTVNAALLASCRIRGYQSKQAAEEMARVIETTRIESLLDLKINGLSKGQARRVGVAAALVGDPPLLVMDEPASGLDVSARIEFNELLGAIGDGRHTVLITSHLLTDIENTCSHIAIMQDGRIKVFDETKRLLRNTEEVDIFVQEKWTEELNHFGLVFEPCKYPQLVRLLPSDRPAYQTLGMLAQRRIAPMRVEPRSDLISFYLDVTDHED
jgi:ABC-2 type transport system ATP-binding protein